MYALFPWSFFARVLLRVAKLFLVPLLKDKAFLLDSPSEAAAAKLRVLSECDLGINII